MRWALSYYYSGNSDKALAKCEEAEIPSLSMIPAFTVLTGSIDDELGRPAEGIVVLKKALEKWPYNTNLIYNLGICYLNAGNPAEGRRSHSEGIAYKSISCQKPYGIGKSQLCYGPDCTILPGLQYGCSDFTQA